MKTTGIIRRVDDLGRIIIPKEVRRNLGIQTGDPFEFFTNSKGEIILVPYKEDGEK